MAAERFFIVRTRPGEGETVILDQEQSHHLRDVVRARTGDEVILLDGEGGRYEAAVRSTEGSGAAVEILHAAVAPQPPQVDLAIAVTKAHRMEIAVEKCAELGIRKIIPLACRNSVWRGGPEEAAHKAERFARKIEAACKQSGNPWFTVVDPVVDVSGLMRLIGGWELVYLADSAGQPAPKTLRRTRQASAVLGIIGPEGGFTQEETASLVAARAIPVTLGPTRLRAETAVICLAWWLLAASGPASPAGK
ncbi:MAG: RsmE family RNA methyltransferase [Candidatus Krumholzibacteria bacterium]|nr:RsmE family RNA methyltransferase [Candidatus Krumholzibacteria bacterium]